MQPSTITVEEKVRITDQNAHLFKARHVNDYWPSEINSQRIMDFLATQLGMQVEEWPYPIHLDQFEVAFEYLNSQDMLYPRPEEEPEPEDPDVVRERDTQQRVRADYAAKVEADKIARAKTIPLAQLGAEVSQQNAIFRNQRNRNELPTRTLRLESRPLMGSKFPVSQEAQARATVALAHPEIKDRNSAEFSRLYAAELARLRS